MRLSLLLVILLLVPPSSASGIPAGYSTLEDFRENCKRFRTGHELVTAPVPTIGKTAYLPVQTLEATQTRFSFLRMIKSLHKIMAQEKWNPGSNWKLPYDKGKAIYPEGRRISGVYYRGKVYIVDGHHRALISTSLGTQTVPVEILADWSDKSNEQFFTALEANGWSYFRDPAGHVSARVDLCDLADDPYLLLVRSVLLRVDFRLDDEGHIHIEKQASQDLAVALKLNRDIPFLEFILADELHRAGFAWQPQDELSETMLSEILDIFKRSDNPLLKSVLLLDKVTPVAKLNLKKLIRAHVDHVHCESQLMSGDGD